MNYQENSPEKETALMVKNDVVWFGFGVFVFLLVVMFVGGIAYFQKKQILVQQDRADIVLPIPTVTTVLSEPEAVETYKRVEILNGSGVVGAAGAIKTRLIAKDSGLEITTGNAPSQKGNVIFFKSNLVKNSILFGQIKEIVSTAEELLDEKISTDIKLVLGK